MSRDPSPCNEEQTSLSSLDLTVDSVVQLMLNREEEVQKLSQLRKQLEYDLEYHNKMEINLMNEKSTLKGEVNKLKIRNAAYQREQRDQRNSLTIIRHKLEKIRESIEKARATQVKDLEDFEASVDEITGKFRSAPIDHKRANLAEKIQAEEGRRRDFKAEMEKLANEYQEFLAEKGLQAREVSEENLLECIGPQSRLFADMETTKTLDLILLEIEKTMSKNGDTLKI